MRRVWCICVIILLLLCAAAPFSSKHPDAVQRLIGLSGGAERFLKAVGGVLVTLIVMRGLLAGLMAMKRRQP